MEYNPSVNIILPDSIGRIENDFDDEDIIHEQTNQNEIVELIMAAFEGHDEPSDDEDRSLNTSDSSHLSSDEQQNQLSHHNHSHQQTLFPTPIISISPPLVLLNNLHTLPITNNEENPKNHILQYQNPHRSALNTLPTDPLQTQYLNETQNQLNQLCILCRVKDHKAYQLQNLCKEFREKYECDTRVLRHKLELTEKAKYDCEQRYQLINTQCEEFMEINNQLHRTIQDSELKIQQLEAGKTRLEKKLSDSESLIESLHRKVNELQQFEAMIRSQQDYEVILSTIREKHEQEIISFNEKLQNIQMNLKEKNIEADELRVQLEIANKNNEQTIFERIEIMNHLNEQLHDCQRKYSDLLTTTSLDSLNQIDIKRQLTHMTEDKEKLESKCQELQSEIRTLRKRHSENDTEVNHTVVCLKSVPIDDHHSIENSALDKSIINENILLKERIDEYVFQEKQLREMNEELKHKIQEMEYQSKRSDSSSSSSTSSNETVITTNIHMDQTRKLSNQIEKLKKDYADLQEQHDYEKQELNSIIEQLREDVNDVDKTKQLYIDICQEKIDIEDTLRSKFEQELQIKLDDLHRMLEKEYQEKLEQDNQSIKRKYHQDLEQEIDRIKVKHEKQITELNNELDRLRANDDAKSRLIYTEKEFEQLKHDYYNLNMKHSELLKTYSKLENENEKMENEMKQLTKHQTQELVSIHEQTDQHQISLKDDFETLQLRLNNYENMISQYEEYRIKLETNLHKITQQRDTSRIELRLTKEMFIKKEVDYNQLKLRFDQCEKNLQTQQEKFRQYESTIQDLQRQGLNQTQSAVIQKTEAEYREQLLSLNDEKYQVEQRLQEANRALDLADSHLQEEIEKIKTNLEQEYNRRYERDHKQHQHDLQQLTNEFNKQRSNSPSTNLPTNSLQDIADVKKIYRTEIDRLYHENLELSQYQSKLIDAHQKQMQIMKKELDDGYHNVINEFQHEQTRLQTRCDQLKQQLNNAEQTIEQLKLNLNQFKTNHHDEKSRVKELHKNEKYTFEHGNRNRLEHLIQLLEQSNTALNNERAVHAQEENEYQQTINSLQKKIADMNKQHAKAMDELKYERLTYQKRIIPRPISVPEFPSNNFSPIDMKSDYETTVEKLRELFTNEMIALLRLTCKMIFDVHHQVIVARYMDNLDISIKKQIQNELIGSRNSMIKEIRREILEKMTDALRSQRVPDKIIDMHLLELDHLLSQMVQDCLNSQPTSSPLSPHITPQQKAHLVVSSSSSSRKSIECLYMTPTVNKKPAPLPPNCRPISDNDRRPKTASNNFSASRNSISSSFLTSHTHKIQQSKDRNVQTKRHRSESDLLTPVQRHQKETKNSDDDILTLCENEKEFPPSNVPFLAQQFEKKSNSLPNHTHMRSRTPERHYITTRIINHNKQEDNEEELSWPQQPISTNSSTHPSGIRKFVRNGLKLLITQQEHKRTRK